MLIFGMSKNGAYAPFLTAERLFIAGLVCGIVKCLDLRETLEDGGVNLGDPVLDWCALDVIFDFAVAKGPFEGDELALLESLGKLGEIAPGIDAMPFGPGFVIALIVLPVFLGSDVKGTTNSRLF